MRDFMKARCVGVVVTLFHLADHFFGSVKAVGEMAVVLLIAGFVSAAFKFVDGGASWCPVSYTHLTLPTIVDV